MIFSILIVIVCVLLILVVLIQNSKGGGIQSQFGAANQIMGVKRGTEVIEKLTWGLAISLFFLSIALAPKNTGTSEVSEEDSMSKVKNRASTAAPLPQQQQQGQNNQVPNQTK
ncbi:MAG: preprotein translocase subunit SecG [Bacteroidota bacterium]|nr:preprotein translocase subunit SecG [Bacteroidota bacterium]